MVRGLQLTSEFVWTSIACSHNVRFWLRDGQLSLDACASLLQCTSMLRMRDVGRSTAPFAAICHS